MGTSESFCRHMCAHSLHIGDSPIGPYHPLMRALMLVVEEEWRTEQEAAYPQSQGMHRQVEISQERGFELPVP